MAYRIFFSGLMAFVEHKKGGQGDSYDQVDVLLLNPCARHDDQHHTGEGGPHDEASCPDRHDPQLLVKSADIADWRLDGVLHGCGRYHFGLRGTVFPQLDGNRPIKLSVPPSDTIGVDPFGEMQHVKFRDGIVDLEKVLGTGGQVNPTYPAFPKGIQEMVVARVRLPKGELTALAPLFGVARGLLGWTVGNQTLDILAEVVMFEPADQDNRRIDVGNGFVTVRKHPDVAVWITNEPPLAVRPRGANILKADHFHHYYDLLAAPPPPNSPLTRAPAPTTQTPTRPVPNLDPPFNAGDPLCPECLIHSPTPLNT